MPNGPRFLVVDDDAADRSGVVHALFDVAYLDEAPDVPSALEAVRAREYDLALVDMSMPSKVVEDLRAVQPGLPIVFLLTSERAQTAPQDVITRPAARDPEELRSVVRSTLESSRLRLEWERAHGRLELAVEAAGLGTWSYDAEARTFRGDARFAALLQLAPAESWSCDDVLRALSSEDRGAVLAGLEHGALTVQVAVGQSRWVDLRGRRERHVPRSLFGTALDVSVQKSEALRSMSLRERLMGVASHDLRNPLSAVRQAALLLAQSPNLDERERRFVSHIRASSERMTMLVSQLLDLTRLRLGGGLTLDRVGVRLRELIEPVVDELRLGSPGRAIDVDAEDCVAFVDPHRFEQVVSNLVANALSHSLEGSVVSLVARHTPEELTLTVHNTGAPIPLHVQQQIFEPFVQVGDKAKRAGLGLGLHITREIVRAHGGTVTVDSSPEAGTEFTVRLPLAVHLHAPQHGLHYAQLPQ